MHTKYTELLHQSLAVFTVVFNEFIVGIATGWIAPILNAEQKPDRQLFLTPDQSSWIASIEHFGKMLGVLAGSVLVDRIGRKPVLVLSTLPFLFMWLVILYTRSVFLICAIRFLFGVAAGFNDASNSIYLGEVSTPLVRSVFGSISVTMIFAGTFVEFVIATYLSYANVAITNAVISTVCVLLPITWLRESPQFLLMRGRHEEAQRNFAWLRGVSDVRDVSNEFEKIQQNVREESAKKVSLKQKLRPRANHKSLLIVAVLYSLVGAAGYFPMLSYVSLAFAETDALTVNELTILFGVCQLLVVASTSFVNKRFNRRPVILASFSVAAAVHAFIAALYYCQERNVLRVPFYSWLIFASITAYASLFAFVYPTVFLIRAELFPLSIKAIGGCVSVVGMFASSFLMTKTFLHISINYGMYCNFFLFSVVNLVIVIFVYCAVPETKNKSLLEIQEQLEK